MTDGEIITQALHGAEIAERMGEIAYVRQMLGIAASALHRNSPRDVEKSVRWLDAHPVVNGRA